MSFYTCCLDDLIQIFFLLRQFVINYKRDKQKQKIEKGSLSLSYGIHTTKFSFKFLPEILKFILNY